MSNVNVNVNPETGIRYGCIYLQGITGDVAESLLYGPGAVDISWKSFIEQAGQEAARLSEEFGEDEDQAEVRLQEALADYYCDEPVIEGVLDGVSYGISWLGGAQLLWIFQSPHIGKYDLCSPCVPNAGNLDSPNPQGFDCYDAPLAWRL